MHGINGDFHQALIFYIIVGIVAVILGTLIGLRFTDRFNISVIKKVLYLIIFLAALNLIFF